MRARTPSRCTRKAKLRQSASIDSFCGYGCGLATAQSTAVRPSRPMHCCDSEIDRCAAVAHCRRITPRARICHWSLPKEGIPRRVGPAPHVRCGAVIAEFLCTRSTSQHQTCVSRPCRLNGRAHPQRQKAKKVDVLARVLSRHPLLP
jgi:hypothetical protein